MTSWTDRFNPFVHWQLYGWCFVIALWLFWEVWGATHHNAATFTYLIRNSVPRWGRILALAVLAWHFVFADCEWWKNLVHWLAKLG